MKASMRDLQGFERSYAPYIVDRLLRRPVYSGMRLRIVKLHSCYFF